uniref:Temporin-1SPa n=1 Tax=Lithobates septentrionalis TaxID=190274 RepID=TP1A_LITST|nr:RecName: Full=Temporin-1SPa [Lithobates septentrionalis]
FLSAITSILGKFF